MNCNKIICNEKRKRKSCQVHASPASCDDVSEHPNEQFAREPDALISMMLSASSGNASVSRLDLTNKLALGPSAGERLGPRPMPPQPVSIRPYFGRYIEVRSGNFRCLSGAVRRSVRLCHLPFGSEINPCFKANKTRAALLSRLKAFMMWCLWNSTVFSLMSKRPAISFMDRPSASN